jgi:hypothetical protein
VDGGTTRQGREGSVGERKKGMWMREGGGAAAVGGEGAFLGREGASKAGRNEFRIFDGDANRIKG